MDKSNKTPKKKIKKTDQVTKVQGVVVQEIPHQTRKPSAEALAEKAKVFLQICIAIGIVILLIAKLFYHLGNSFDFNLGWEFKLGFIKTNTYFIEVLRLPTLELVGKALAYAAGIDLAYMLLTPGPDEAIEPLILGLASAILFSVSRIGDTNIELAQEIGLYVIILSGLFFIKALFIPSKSNETDQDLISLLKTIFTNWFNGMKRILRIT